MSYLHKIYSNTSSFSRMITAGHMKMLGLSYTKQPCKKNGDEYANSAERFQRIYGVRACIVARVWNMLMQRESFRQAGLSPSPQHILFSLFFLFNYTNEYVAAAHFGVTRKTFRKWQWLFTYAIGGLKREVVRHIIIATFPVRTNNFQTTYLFFHSDNLGEPSHAV